MARKLFLGLAGLLVAGAVEGEVSKELARQLLQDFLPAPVVQCWEESMEAFGWPEDEVHPREALRLIGTEDWRDLAWRPDVGQWEYRAEGRAMVHELALPKDPRQFVLLIYYDFPGGIKPGCGIFWRLVARQGEGPFVVVQDAEEWLAVGLPKIHNLMYFWASQADLDSDGMPELLLHYGSIPHQGYAGETYQLYVYAWRGGKLVRICPECIVPETENKEYRIAGLPLICTAFESDNMTPQSHVDIVDLDKDGKAEVVAYPRYEKVWASEDPSITDEEWDFKPYTPTRIFRLENGFYKLWKEVPAEDPFPFHVPALGVVHPGTVPLSELQRAKGEGEWRIFISTPAQGTEEADSPYLFTTNDYQVESFQVEFNRAPARFKKVWPNGKRPTRQGVNDWVFGVWVSMGVRQPCGGLWQVNPEEPTYPHPDPCRQYYFHEPYLEVTVRREVVREYLRQQAERLFAANPEKQEVWVSLPLRGQLKNGKEVAVEAVLMVSKKPR